MSAPTISFSQLAVEPYRLLRLPDVRGDAPVVQLPQGLWSDAESFVEALREDHHGSAVLQRLLDVGGSWTPGSWRVPVSFQSRSLAPPGKSSASSKGPSSPSTPRRPQETSSGMERGRSGTPSSVTVVRESTLKGAPPAASSLGRIVSARPSSAEQITTPAASRGVRRAARARRTIEPNIKVARLVDDLVTCWKLLTRVYAR